MFRFAGKIIVWSAFVCCSVCPASDGQSLPGEKDIASDAAAAESIFKEFMQTSLLPNLIYEYTNGILSRSDGEILVHAGKKGNSALAGVTAASQAKKAQIEAYEGDDWDRRYGVTGLWRRLALDIQAARLIKLNMEYYTALSLPPSQRKGSFAGVIEALNADEKMQNWTDARILRFRVLVSLAALDSLYRDSAEKCGSDLETAADERIYFDAVVLNMRLSNKPDTAKLNRIAEKLSKSSSGSDARLWAGLVFAELKAGSDKILQKVALERPDTARLLGCVFLKAWQTMLECEKLSDDYLSSGTVLQAELAAQSLLAEGAGNYKKLLELLCRIEKFRQPSVLFAAAEAMTEDAPDAAIENYLLAATLAAKKDNAVVYLSPEFIAHRCAESAISIYNRNERYKPQCLKALEYYCNTYPAADDEKFMYCYAKLLAGGTPESAKKVLALTEKIRQDGKTLVLRAVAFEQLEDYMGAAKEFCRAVEPNDCAILPDVADFVERLRPDTEEYQAKVDNFADFAGFCYMLADYCMSCSPPRLKKRFALMSAEFAILTGRQDMLDIAQTLLAGAEDNGQDRDIDRLRCQGRLAEAKGEFETAAVLWGQVCSIENQPAGSAGKSNRWWMAKYHQLRCSANRSGEDREEIIRAVSILQNSYDNIPAFWAGKIAGLKQKYTDPN